MALRLSQFLIGRISNTDIYYKKVQLIYNRCTCSRQATFKNYSTLDSVTSEQIQQKKKKTAVIPKITLVQGDIVSITTLEEAQKLSKRRDLKLVKIVDEDTKTQRPIYKLMTANEYHAEDLKQREQKKKSKEGAIKGEKLIIFNYNIAKHDVETNMKKILKWVEKLYEVRVVINGDASNMQKAVSTELYQVSNMNNPHNS